ncbi:hypothetical protein T08_12998 [Trichinella sp. T8]|nr:hypothetical protein T08_12998 [Trichinella sp. T8]
MVRIVTHKAKVRELCNTLLTTTAQLAQSDVPDGTTPTQSV